jgi:hypothetical protein
MNDASPPAADDAQPSSTEPLASTDPLAAIRKERRCAIPRCPTTLSVYNHGYLCYVHSSQKAAQALARYPYRQGRGYSD